MATILVLAVWAGSGLLARHWLKPQDIETSYVASSLVLMGIAMGIQRLRGVFQATLEGLERQVTCNVLLASTGILRLVLGLGALAVEPSAHAFFWSQIAASIVETGSFALVVARVVPGAFRPRRLEMALIGQTVAFASTNMASAATGTFVQIADSSSSAPCCRSPSSAPIRWSPPCARPWCG
ncbi:hypothetical protein [Teichococcus aestuarii]|uniref:hypothetical protein n=1 Tax=Teichococcus aestuarii TaxID=568898 RepID=UPI00360D45F9